MVAHFEWLSTVCHHYSLTALFYAVIRDDTGVFQCQPANISFNVAASNFTLIF